MATEKDWVLEHRHTTSFSVAQFYQQLTTPGWAQVAKRFHLGNVQRIYYWKRHNFLPLAVYRAFIAAYGTPKFHTPPEWELARQPSRLPPFFGKYLGDVAAVPEPPVVVDVAPPPPTPPPTPPAPLVAQVQGLPVDIHWHGPSTVTLRIELVTVPPAPAPAAPHPEIETRLRARVAELEAQLEDERAVKLANTVPSGGDLTKDAKHLIRSVAKRDPHQARALASLLPHKR